MLSSLKKDDVLLNKTNTVRGLFTRGRASCLLGRRMVLSSWLPSPGLMTRRVVYLDLCHNVIRVEFVARAAKELCNVGIAFDWDVACRMNDQTG